MSISSLESLLRIVNPNSIAVIGASEVPGKAGERRLRSLIQSGFSGKIYPVNPRRTRVQGLKAYSSILDIKDDIDLALIVVSPERVPACVQQCSQRNVSGVVVVTAGAGGAEDPYSKNLLESIEGSATRLIGPNCSGIYSAQSNVNLLGIPSIPSGSIGVISQSGNIIDSLLHYSRDYPFGFSRIFGVGNALDLGVVDYLRYFAEDSETEIILAYIEGFTQALELLEVARAIIPHKPIVAIKVGDTEAGARAVQSHTASLATDVRVTDAILKQAGIIRVQEPIELWETALAYLKLPPVRGKRVALMSEGGGHNAVAADSLSQQGFTIPTLGEDLQRLIRPHLLPNMSAANPIDYGGTAEENPHVIAECVKPCLSSDEVDAVVLTGFFGGYGEFIAEHIYSRENETARTLADLAKTHDTPLLIHSSFVGSGVQSLELLRSSNVAIFRSISSLTNILSNVEQYYSSAEYFTQQSHLQNREECSGGGILEDAKRAGHRNLTEVEARAFLSRYNLPLLDARLATTRDELSSVVEEFGFPLALKIVSREIIHKSDIGGVILNVDSEDKLLKSFELIIERGRAQYPESQIDGVLVSPMACSGHECIAGFSRDPNFGPVIMYGTGGTHVELLGDVALRGLPLLTSEVPQMLDEVQGTALMRGYRGKPEYDTGPLESILKTLAMIAGEHPEIAELDLNPVIVNEYGTTIVDARITLVEHG